MAVAINGIRRIDELDTLTSGLTDDDLLVIKPSDGTGTKSITVGVLRTMLKEEEKTEDEQQEEQVLPISRGGTGASTAAEAIANLGLSQELDLSYKPGDTLVIVSNTTLAGYISAAAKQLFFAIPTPKLLKNISSVKIECSDFTARGISGYICTDVNITSLGTVAVGVAADNLLRVYVTSSSTLSNATNNTPISVEGNITLTFS